MTHEGPAVCKQLEEYLFTKLSKDHAGVKFKVLRIIKFICENDGSIEFRRLLQRKVDLIRQCQSYRGASDPLRGDSPNKSVRDEATAAMQALFATENSAQSSSHAVANQTIHSRIGGIGSSDFGPVISKPASSMSSSYTSSSASRPMESMGNPYFASQVTASPTASLSSIMQSDSPAREIISAVTTGVQSVAQSLAKAANPYLPASMQPTSSSGYSSSQDNYVPSYRQRSDWVPPRISSETPQFVSPESTPTTHIKQAMNELCLSNPARVVPTQQALDVFLEKSQSLDGSALADVMTEKLQDSATPWVQKMKVLAGIETLHKANLDLVTASLKDNPIGLLSLLSSPQCGSKARQVAALLGVIDGKPTTTRSPPLIDDLIDVGSESKDSNDLLLDFEEQTPLGPASYMDSLI
jgi:hypothetical protein